MKSTEALALEALLLEDDDEAAELVAEMLPGERTALRAAALRLASLAAGSPALCNRVSMNNSPELRQP